MPRPRPRTLAFAWLYIVGAIATLVVGTQALEERSRRGGGGHEPSDRDIEVVAAVALCWPVAFPGVVAAGLLSKAVRR